MADHLANSWESPVGSLVEGDPIVALSWLHNGVKLALHVEKVGVLGTQRITSYSRRHLLPTTSNLEACNPDPRSCL